ncbi:MAG TPA: putative sulfate/molybdate transporter [Acidimicrobiia bacterium]|nr:putative sulfate/molybdate transporter [Acidimicrobiia bacterium]
MRSALRPTTGDLTGAVADLGVFVPLVAALVLVNGLHPGSVLLAAGILVVAAGAVFRIPFPVQPLKALTALAVAQQLSPDLIHAAGLQIGIILALLAATGAADRIARFFTVPVIRSLQFAVGALLVVTAVRLVVAPPAILDRGIPTQVSLIVGIAVLGIVTVAAARRWFFLVAAVVVGGVAWSIATGEITLATPAIHFPAFAPPPLAVFGSAFVLLVIPQLPLTYSNAIVGVSHLARETFPEAADRVTPARVSLVCGAGNVVSSMFGGMPMCHGSSGFTAHVRLGASTPAMNLVLGGLFITLGLFLSSQVLALFALVPVSVLAAFLAYAGLRHALLVLDLRGTALALALVAGTVGVVTRNLAITTAIALLAEFGRRRAAARL